ncbi:MAG: helix-turn-helix domain-containing protein [Bacteroidota bacterium]|nr:helix-turn-helix domain-containing protein [Bacteroidota bacterium]
MYQPFNLQNLAGQNVQLVISADALLQFGKEIETNIIQSLSGKIDSKHSMNDDELLSAEKTAEFFGKTRQTIHAWKKAGLLPFIRISNKIYFRKSDLLSFNVINLKRRA